ncbi:MAG TPA: transposase, partial [Anaerolineales bacterium]
MDLFISMLTGGIGVVEVNQRVRPDEILQHAFGRQGCAEQSGISRTLNACTAINVAQLRQAVVEVLQRIGRCVHHRYEQGPLVLDVDMMSLPTECAGEGVEKGYFSYHRGRRGRQIARVCASEYNEMLVDRLYSGKRQLEASVLDLAAEVEPILKLNEPGAESLRKQVIYRLDAGGGTTRIIEGLLARDYAVLTKMHSWRGVQKLLESVPHWIADPKVPQRSIGWVTQPYPFCCPTRQLGIRFRDEKGKAHQAVLVSSLGIDQIATLLRQPLTSDRLDQSPWLLLHVYDDRSGGVETQNRNDRQGLGITQRHVHSFAAEEMKLLLYQLAHNF